VSERPVTDESSDAAAEYRQQLMKQLRVAQKSVLRGRWELP